MPPIGVITGLVTEAKCLPRSTPDGVLRVRISGARTERAEALANDLLSEGCRALVSFGVAGGLRSDLRAGDLLLPDIVITTEGIRWPVNPEWRASLAATLPAGSAPAGGAVAGSVKLISTIEEKRQLEGATGAAAVDMESQAVARIAARNAVPFLVVRAIADPANVALPPWLTNCIDSDGETRLSSVLGALRRRPQDVLPLFGIARQNRRALATLGRVAPLLGPSFELLG